VGDVVRTRGRITFKESKEGGIDIHADYTFVYPLVEAEQGGDAVVARTIVRRVLDVQVLSSAAYQVTPGALAVVRFDHEIGNSACDVYDGFLHPQFGDDPSAGAAPTGPTVDPYDRSRELGADQPAGCGAVSRT
jgi:hypothetical protein